MASHLRALLATGALLLSSGAALAAAATASTNVNVRSGPGQQYQVIDVLPAGETVNLVGCDEAWCEVSMGRDGTGYALAELFDFRNRPPFVRFGGGSRVIIEEDDPIIVRDYAIGGYWENRPYYVRDGYYYWGGRWYGSRPGVGNWRDRSWRRWDDRRGWGDRGRGGRDWGDRSARNRDDRPGDTRGGFTNRPPRVDEPRWRDRPNDGRGRDVTNRNPRVDEPRGGRGDGDRGGRFSEPGGGRDRGDRDGGRVVGREASGDGRMSPMERVDAPRDRGDRMGLDRAGGGGGRGEGGRGGGREGGGGGRGEGRDR